MMKLRMLRIFLGLGALTWGAAVPGVFLSWDTAATAMEGFGAKSVEYDKMLDYWLRMASGGFGLIGCFFLLPALRLEKYRAFVPWLGWLAIAEGLVLLVHGVRLNLDPFPFIGDVAACFVSGIGIVVCWAAVTAFDFASAGNGNREAVDT